MRIFRFSARVKTAGILKYFKVLTTPLKTKKAVFQPKPVLKWVLANDTNYNGIKILNSSKESVSISTASSIFENVDLMTDSLFNCDVSSNPDITDGRYTITVYHKLKR